MITIYSLNDPITGECRYIGKAINVEKRLREHRCEVNNPRFHTHKVNWWRTLPSEPEVKVLQVVNDDCWAEAERYWINKMRFGFANLTNIASGGQTSPVEGRGHTEATKQKIREANLRLGKRPPLRTGCTPWNKGVKVGIAPPNKGTHKQYCRNGHLMEGGNIEIAVKNSEHRTYYRCRICHINQQHAYSNKQKEV